jgi:hypothetical protein
MPVFVKCNKCGAENKCAHQAESKLVMDVFTFDGVTQRCRKCRRSFPVLTGKIYWKD